MLANWERNKQAEKKRTHLFEGIPAAMPALARAAKAERKLASVELGWRRPGSTPGRSSRRWRRCCGSPTSDGPLDEETAAAAGALLLEEARLIAHQGEDPESLVRQALDRLGAQGGGRRGGRRRVEAPTSGRSSPPGASSCGGPGAD